MSFDNLQAVYDGNMEIDLMTSHHESCKPAASERVRQLSLCFRRMLEAPPNRSVLFGGDLNMRDDEVRPLLIKKIATYLFFLAQTSRWRSTRNQWCVDCQRTKRRTRLHMGYGIKYKPRVSARSISTSMPFRSIVFPTSHVVLDQSQACLFQTGRTWSDWINSTLLLGSLGNPSRIRTCDIRWCIGQERYIHLLFKMRWFTENKSLLCN